MALLLFVGTSLAFNSGPALRFSRLGSAQRSAAARAPLPFSVATAPDLAEKTGVPYGELTVGVIKETQKLESRCAQSPQSAGSLAKAGFKVVVEKGAGAAAGFSDEAYEAEGATVVPNAEAWKSDIVIKLNPPSSAELAKLQDRTLISLLNPQKNEAALAQLQKQKATAFALDMIPRMLSRGQAFDVLSSQTNIIGYRAVVEAQNVFGRFFAGQMTAAGKVPPHACMLPCLCPRCRLTRGAAAAAFQLTRVLYIASPCRCRPRRSSSSARASRASRRSR